MLTVDGIKKHADVICERALSMKLANHKFIAKVDYY